MITPDRHHQSLPAMRRLMLALTVVFITLAANAMAADMIPGSRSSVTVEVNKGTVVRLSRPASTVFVADPEVCDIQMKSPRLVYLLGKRSGQTTLFAVDGAENVISNIDVTVTQNLSRLRDSIRSLHPDALVRVSSIEGAVVLEGTVDEAVVAQDIADFAAAVLGKDQRVINRLGVSSPVQVNLRVRVAEITKDVEKQLGIRWDLVSEVFGLDMAVSFINPFATALNSDSVLFSGSRGSTSIDALINAMDEEGLISILAEPNLTALSGETASFLAGGEFPILVPDDGRITIEFKKFGISLAFTPTILSGERINLHVRPEVSELTSDNGISLPVGFFGEAVSVPSLNVRRAETTVEIASGQSFAIAGLMKNNSSHDIRKVPGLGDVPILGRLFSSEAFKRDESELVIIVTPYIVRPSPERLPGPTDGFLPPNDVERLFPRGGTFKRNPVAGPESTVQPDGTRLMGPVGFALE
ncbi:MAG: type II and III secretion system protein family protein [Hyphomicrobiales bacterium]|nr:type II and III secretion system protein family protein [Hyphomicrobiales bacterium]